MNYDFVKYYSDEANIRNEIKTSSLKRIFSNLLSITAILLLGGLLNVIIICAKIETIDARIYHIYERNLSEIESAEHPWFRSSNENPQLKNPEDEIKDTLLSSESSNSEDDVKHNDVSSEEKCDNINYNDLSKQLTLEELDNVLDNLEEHPSNIDLYNIWNHVLGISKEGFDDMLKDLSYDIEYYLLKYIYQRYDVSYKHMCFKTMYHTWHKSMHDIGVVLSSTDMEYTLKFYSLIKDGGSIHEMKNFIYSYLSYYGTLKNDLYNEHKKIFTERMKNPQRLDI
ncbi:Plasmodium exported protein (PHISTa), unknown, putative [Plasmodium sp.]|nr:Plasmodium exported protein (PHISTa), unknown, putative [Plasmodium sp.]